MRTTVALMLCACSIHSVCANENTYTETPLTADARDHWAFQPRANVSAPQPKQLSTWCRTPIDRFIAAALEDRNLQPQPAASRQELIRRATLSLTGLPPKWKDVCRFAEDTSPKAFNRLVDELLESPSCGEHAAQFWLDLARFAETDGFEHDKTRSDAWKYRDWVIQAFNDDVPYDQFLRLQLAGDLLEPNHPDAHVATHFCVAGPDMPDINSQEERRHVLLNELTSTVGEVVLGLQVGCAECHDHKYDPISQADFYRLRSVFEPAIQLRKNVSVRTLVETAPYQQSSHVMIRGDFQRPGPKIQPAPLRLFRSTLSDVTASEMELAFRANRRKALADWVTQPDHPLTARVIVNRLWQQHFGRGLSESPSDFGIMGQEPTHPELLDWLANWFVDNGWSIRKFHRLILTSAVWQQQSRFTGNADSTAATQWHQALREDPDARLLSRFPRQRLSGEVIRDSMLAVSDSLNRKTGGPGIRPPLPQELTSTLLKNQWDVTEDDSEHRRRSIYIFARRNLRFPIFEAFDRPAANDSCPVRNVSTTAPQSLYLLNSDFTLECAQRLADVMKAEHDTVTEQVNEVFRKVFSRHPTDDELQQVEAFLQQSPADSGLTHLCLSLFNSNEFVFLE